jgi:secreted PhoX family phosphatase
VYETEDRNEAGFYRFIPKQKGKLAAGGKLQMMKVQGQPNLSGGVDPKAVFKCDWVGIAEPTRAHSPGTRDAGGVFRQGAEQGGTQFARLEGCWYGQGLIYFASTSGGAKKCGQIWLYDPKREELRMIFESPAREVLNHPDNVTVSPRGNGIVLCEDGEGPGLRLMGLTREGRIFELVQNNSILDGRRNGIKGDFRGSEWAGVTFSPDGKWLFANLQRPGFTIAITGPWEQGAL